MPAALLFPILLRAAGPIAFILATLTAGAMNQTVMIVPLLALAATLATILIRKVSPSPAVELAAMMNPNAPPKKKSAFDGAGQRLGAGLVGYGACFGLAALIAALFQETEFNRTLTLTDAWLILLPAILAVLAAMLSARLGADQIVSMAAQMEDMLKQAKAQSGHPDDGSDPDDSFTVEGEIIDKDKGL